MPCRCVWESIFNIKGKTDVSLQDRVHTSELPACVKDALYTCCQPLPCLLMPLVCSCPTSLYAQLTLCCACHSGARWQGHTEVSLNLIAHIVFNVLRNAPQAEVRARMAALPEVDVQMLKQAVGLGREEAIDSIRHAGQIKQPGH